LIFSNTSRDVNSCENNCQELKNCKIEKIHPPVFVSDAEVNIAIVSVVCPDGRTQTVKAYREEAVALREFIKSLA